MSIMVSGATAMACARSNHVDDPIYHLESEQGVTVRLTANRMVLREQQQRLERAAESIARDLAIVTHALDGDVPLYVVTHPPVDYEDYHL